MIIFTFRFILLLFLIKFAKKQTLQMRPRMPMKLAKVMIERW